MAQGAPVPRVPTGEVRQEPVDAAPSKQNLATWWKQFKKNTRKEEEAGSGVGGPGPVAPIEQQQPQGIFGVPLQTSIRYANVAISLLDSEGHSFIYGYVPIVVAKCGVFLKERATDVEGIFRLAGAERRIKQLQTVFNSPDRYGKGLDWTGYTVHDAANILRRYLNQLPEPIIPLDFYWRFREPLRHHQAQAVGQMDHQEKDEGGFDEETAILTYQKLITELPTLNRQLLLYILDLLAVFASKADFNRMNAPNLAAIFQPGLLSHPEHQLHPHEYRLSQDVLIFLIENQDHFLVGMQGTAVDEKTIQEVQSGAPTPAKPPPSPNTAKARLFGRSSSNASAGADSVRRYGGIRRNVSTSSKHSRQSNHTPSPVTPPPSSPFAAGAKSGIHRSNTVPSKKSPALSGHERFSRERSTETPATPATPAAGIVTTVAPASPLAPSANETTAQAVEPPEKAPSQNSLGVTEPVAVRDSSQERQSRGTLRVDMPASSSPRISPSGTPLKDRALSNFFKSTAGAEADKKDTKPRNKLQKRRPDAGLSAASSTASLGATSHQSSPGYPAQSSAQEPSEARLDGRQSELSFRTANQEMEPAEAVSAKPAQGTAEDMLSADPTSTATSTALRDHPQRVSHSTLKPDQSPRISQTSHSSGNEEAVHETGEGEASEEKAEKRRRWRISRTHRESKATNEPTHSGVLLGLNSGAERSASSIGSGGRPRKSMTDDSSHSNPSAAMQSASDADAVPVGSPPSEKRGPLGWFKGKLQERKEREAEKERAKSPPPPAERDNSASKSSLTAVTKEGSTVQSTEAEQPEIATGTQPATQTEEPAKEEATAL